MPYAIVVYRKKGPAEFKRINTVLTEKEAKATLKRWMKEEIGMGFIPKDTYMMTLFKVEEIDTQ